MTKPEPTNNISAVIRKLASLPPLSRQSQRILITLADPELDFHPLLELLRQSPPLAARILGIARSAFFAGPLPTRDLAEAWACIMHSWKPKATGIADLARQPGRHQ